MILSTSSIVSTVFTGSLLILALWLYLRDVDRIARVGTGVIFILMAIVFFRVLLPLEYSFTKTVNSEYIMVFIHETLKSRILLLHQDISVRSVILAIWFAGTIISARRIINARMDFENFIKQMPVSEDRTVNELITTITHEYKKPIPFKVLLSNKVDTPMLYGIKNPKIIVPIMDLTESEWYFILKHEIAHYYNRDLLIILLLQCVNAIYWWNPFLRILNKEVDKILEIRADAAVTKNLGEEDKLEYLYCLLHMLKSFREESRRNYAVALSGARKSLICHRYELILAERKRSKRRMNANVMTALLVLSLYFSFMTVFEPAYYPTGKEAEGIFMLTDDNSFLLENPQGCYTVYYNDEVFFDTTEMDESLVELAIYTNVDEALEERARNRTFPYYIIRKGTKLLEFYAPWA